MKIDAMDIKAVIVSGLKKAWLNHFFMTGKMGEDIKPEYLTTASICYAFSDYIQSKGIIGDLVVRAEELTRNIWTKTQLPLFLTRVLKRADLKKDSDCRMGSVDITLAVNNHGLETTFAVIENKGFLVFTENGELYSGSRNEFEKDLIRNIEFLSEIQKNKGIEYSAFTFYLRDKKSFLKEDGEKYCQQKKAYFENEVKLMLKDCLSNLIVNVEIDSLDDGLFDSYESANEYDDESGQTTLDRDGKWHIVYGVISIYKNQS